MEIKSKKLKGKKIIYAITGSIACVESIKVARELRRHGAKVIGIMSENAKKFLTPYSFQFAVDSLITELSGKAEHLIKADLMLIAPATANTIAKIANGIADNIVTTFALSHKKILIAPAMDKSMYENDITRKNIRQCKKMGMEFIPPKIEEGKAKMADIETIVEAVIRAIRKEKEKKLLIIGGNTMEAIDDVRAITNFSSGKMAMALIREAYERVDSVEAWLGNIECPSFLKNCKKFKSIKDLMNLIKKAGKYDAIINCAAISDFIIEKRRGKIQSGKKISLALKPAPRVNKMLREHAGKLIIFKLDELDRLIERAEERKEMDKADYVIANPLENIGASKGKFFIIGNEMKEVEGDKNEVAKYIIDLI